MRPENKNLSGWLAIDKPSGLTSAAVVGKIKRLLKVKKVGHAGTLDPMATGILPIAIEEATKSVQFAMGKEKEYIFDIYFGAETDTLDKEGKITKDGGRTPSDKEIEATLPLFIGTVDQTPPAYSAIKIGGKKSYELARNGNEVELASRKVQINEISLINQISGNEFRIHVSCGKGTYVRSLARDIAYNLGTYAHLSALRRTKVGQFNEKNAISLEKLEELVHNGALFERLLPVEAVLDDILVINLDAPEESKIRNGQTVYFENVDPSYSGQAYTKLGNKVIAIGEVSKMKFKPIRVFNY